MDIQALNGLLSLQSLDVSAARALQLRAGQQMFATIIDMVGDRALVDLAGQRLPASVQTDQPLQPGQVVQLEVAQVTPEQVTLRLVHPSAPSATPEAGASQLLQTLGLPDDALDRNAVMALMAGGQAVTAATVLDVRSLALALQLTSPQELRAIAFLLARDLPVTPALVDVVQQGLFGKREPAGIGQEARQLAQTLLRTLDQQDGGLQRIAGDLRELLEQLPPDMPSGPPPPSLLLSTLQQLVTSLESNLAQLAGDEEPPPSPDPSSQSNTSTAAASPDAGAPDPSAEGGRPAPPDAHASPSRPAAEATSGAQEAPDETADRPRAETPGVAQPGNSGFLAEPPEAHPLTGRPAGAGVSAPNQPDLGALGKDPTISRPSLPPSPPARLPSDGPPTQSNAAGAAPDVPRLPLPHAPAASPQLAVRHAIESLDRALAGGSLAPDQQAVATQLRTSLHELVQAVQFHQLQNSPAGETSPNPNFFILSLPVGPGPSARQAELRVSFKDRDGKRRIDPDDVHLVFQLQMTRLGQILISLHVFQRRIACTIEAESPRVERALSEASPGLKSSLEGLGYAVDAIRCAVSAVAGAPPPATQLLPGAGRVNVEA